MDRDDIVKFANEYLGVYAYTDYGPQGMQYLGVDTVEKIATCVSATSETIMRATFWGADMLIAHHGLFWNTEPRSFDDRHYLRMNALYESGLSLLGYHLCLDAHPEVGNNILAVKALGVDNPVPFAEIGWGGEITQDRDKSIVSKIADSYKGATITQFIYGENPPKKVCAITGGGGNFIHEAVREGYDMIFTGEAEEPSRALASELKISFVAAGHHNTEKAGVKALGEKIAKEFEIKHQFMDVNNPV